MRLQPRQLEAGAPPAGRRDEAGFAGSFWELLIAVVIISVTFGSVIMAYLSTATQSEWSAYSLAAQALGMQTIEQAKAATWDTAAGNNQLTNMTLIGSSLTTGTATNCPPSYTYSGYTTNILDVPWKGTNATIATNFVTIRLFYEDNNSSQKVMAQMIRVDTVWPFTGWQGRTRFYTNTSCTYLAPDNQDPSTF